MRGVRWSGSGMSSNSATYTNREHTLRYNYLNQELNEGAYCVYLSYL
jgi:hypothetical protein